MTPAAVENHSIAVAAASLEGVATAVGPDRALILAICDADGRPSDVVVRDQSGKLAILAGVPEDARPDLGGVVSLASGELRHAASAASAITSDALAASQLAGREVPLHTILECAPIPLLLTDPDGMVAYASAGSQDLGYSSASLIGHRLLDFVHSDDRGRLAAD